MAVQVRALCSFTYFTQIVRGLNLLGNAMLGLGLPHQSVYFRLVPTSFGPRDDTTPSLQHIENRKTQSTIGPAPLGIEPDTDYITSQHTRKNIQRPQDLSIQNHRENPYRAKSVDHLINIATRFAIQQDVIRSDLASNQSTYSLQSTSRDSRRDLPRRASIPL